MCSTRPTRVPSGRWSISNGLRRHHNSNLWAVRFRFAAADLLGCRLDNFAVGGRLRYMPRKRKTITLYDLVAHLATKRDLQALERKTEAGFEQLVVTLNAALKLMQNE